MTFTEIVASVADRMNLTSTEAITRIGQSVNEKYKMVASSLSIPTIGRGTATGVTTISDRRVMFGPAPRGVQKVTAVYNLGVSTLPLDESSYEELKTDIERSGNSPRAWATQLMGAKSVTIYLDMTPTAVFTLTADVMQAQPILSGDMEPAFSENFHDILTLWAMSIELTKMEKYDMASIKEDQCEARVSDLRMHIAVSGGNHQYQGKRPGGRTRAFYV